LHFEIVALIVVAVCGGDGEVVSVMVIDNGEIQVGTTARGVIGN
jgi:hypothetical protein